jgi:hypothetical protein
MPPERDLKGVRELSALGSVVGKLVVGEDGSSSDVGSHVKSSPLGCVASGNVSGIK